MNVMCTFPFSWSCLAGVVVPDEDGVISEGETAKDGTWCTVTLSCCSSFSADFMGVVDFRSLLPLRPLLLPFGGVGGVDWVLVELLLEWVDMTGSVERRCLPIILYSNCRQPVVCVWWFGSYSVLSNEYYSYTLTTWNHACWKPFIAVHKNEVKGH